MVWQGLATAVFVVCGTCFAITMVVLRVIGTEARRLEHTFGRPRLNHGQLRVQPIPVVENDRRMRRF